VADSSPLHQLEQEDLATSPLSWSSVTSTDGALVVDYSRFGRDGGPSSFDIQVAPEAATEGTDRPVAER
jgi:hypothetical protein